MVSGKPKKIYIGKHIVPMRYSVAANFDKPLFFAKKPIHPNIIPNVNVHICTMSKRTITYITFNGVELNPIKEKMGPNVC